MYHLAERGELESQNVSEWPIQFMLLKIWLRGNIDRTGHRKEPVVASKRDNI